MQQDLACCGKVLMPQYCLSQLAAAYQLLRLLLAAETRESTARNLTETQLPRESAICHIT